MQHLSGHDDRPSSFNTGPDNILLDERDLFRRNFNGQITPCNHDPIGMVQDFIQILNSLGIFNFSNDFNGGFFSVQNGLNGHDIFFVSHKRMGNKIQILVCCKFNKGFVLFAQGRQLDMDRRDIDTFPRINDAVIFHMAGQIVFIFFHDGKGDTAVIN